MRCITVGHTILAASGRWTPSFFFGAANVPLAAYEMIELRQLVSVSKKAIDPQTFIVCSSRLSTHSLSNFILLLLLVIQEYFNYSTGHLVSG